MERPIKDDMMLAAGMMVTVVTFISASEVGRYMATWMVLWGAMVFGGIQFLSGMGQLGQFSALSNNGVIDSPPLALVN